MVVDDHHARSSTALDGHRLTLPPPAGLVRRQPLRRACGDSLIERPRVCRNLPAGPSLRAHSAVCKCAAHGSAGKVKQGPEHEPMVRGSAAPGTARNYVSRYPKCAATVTWAGLVTATIRVIQATATRTVTVVPFDVSLSTSNVPPASCARSRMLSSPYPLASAPVSNPTPLSRTASSTEPSRRASETATVVASACLRTLLIAS